MPNYGHYNTVILHKKAPQRVCCGAWSTRL